MRYLGLILIQICLPAVQLWQTDNTNVIRKRDLKSPARKVGITNPDQQKDG